ncbi:hypothetical protein Tco_0067780 [Tanacetum coccineum]
MISQMDLKVKLLHKIYESKSNTTHPTNQMLYDTLFESVCLDHDALNAQDADPSFHKRSHDNQDPLDNREGENRLKKRKDVGEPSFRSSRQNKSLVVHAQDDTHAMKPLDQVDEYVRNHPNLEWFLKKSGSSTMAIAKKLKAIIQKDELTIADLNDGAKKLIVTSLKPLMVFTNGKINELTSSKKKRVPELKEMSTQI